MTIVKFQRNTTTKLYRQELRFLCTARRLIILYNCMKFLENILKGFKVIERLVNTIVKIQREITTKLYI